MYYPHISMNIQINIFSINLIMNQFFLRERDRKERERERERFDCYYGKNEKYSKYRYKNTTKSGMYLNKSQNCSLVSKMFYMHNHSTSLSRTMTMPGNIWTKSS